MSVQRKCKHCGNTKLINEFPPYRADGKVGRRHTCRVCWNKKWTPVVAAHNKRYYHENTNGYRDRQQRRTAIRHKSEKEKHNERNRQYAARHPKKHAAKVAVMMAVRSGRLVGKPCEVCGATKAQAHHGRQWRVSLL